MIFFKLCEDKNLKFLKGSEENKTRTEKKAYLYNIHATYFSVHNNVSLVAKFQLQSPKLTTVRPQDTRPQAARTLTMHIFEQGQNNFRCTNLCSENLKLHDF